MPRSRRDLGKEGKAKAGRRAHLLGDFSSVASTGTAHGSWGGYVAVSAFLGSRSIHIQGESNALLVFLALRLPK